MKRRIAYSMVGMLAIITIVLMIYLRPSPSEREHLKPSNSPEALPVPKSPGRQEVSSAAALAGGSPDRSPQSNNARVLNANDPDVRFFGRVVDQFDAPVPNASISFRPTPPSDFERSEWIRSTELHCDRDGRFIIRGLKADALEIEATVPPGYERTETTFRTIVFGKSSPEMMRQFGNSLLPPYRPNPREPVRFALRKINGDPLTHLEKDYDLPNDGKPLYVSLVDGSVARGEPEDPHSISILYSADMASARQLTNRLVFDWRCEISVANGGIVIRQHDPGYMAPAAGYGPSVAVAWHASDTENWRHFLTGEYYVRFQDGTFGRVYISVEVRKQSFVRIKSFYNPSGGTNTEFDPSLE